MIKHDEHPSLSGQKGLNKRNVIVLADALKHQKGCRAISAIDDKVRAARWDGIGITGAEPHLLLGFAQEDSELSLDDVERILDIAVVMPGYCLRRRNLEFVDAEAGPFGMAGTALDFVMLAGVFDWFHVAHQ